jgi:hypothetical protein
LSPSGEQRPRNHLWAICLPSRGYTTTRTRSRPLRDAIVDLQRDDKLTKAALDAVIDAQGHELKRRLYPEAAAGYLKFLGKRRVEWMTPPRGTWVEGRLGIRVNPELALRMGGKSTVIKLHFKREDLTRPRVQASIGVMLAELGASTPSGTQFGSSTSARESCSWPTAGGTRRTRRSSSVQRRGRS